LGADLPKRKYKLEAPESEAELREQFNLIQNDLAERREAKRIAMERYRAKKRVKPAND